MTTISIIACYRDFCLVESCDCCSGLAFPRSFIPPPPTQSWTETRSGEGACNFLTGAGGFLQSIVNGYVGLRVRLIDYHQVEPRCPMGTRHVSAMFLDPKHRLPVPAHTKQTVRLVGLHFQQRQLNLCLDYLHQTMSMQLTRGNPLRVGHQLGSEWVFDQIIRVDSDELKLPFKPLCLVN